MFHTRAAWLLGFFVLRVWPRRKIYFISKRSFKDLSVNHFAVINVTTHSCVCIPEWSGIFMAILKPQISHELTVKYPDRNFLFVLVSEIYATTDYMLGTAECIMTFSEIRKCQGVKTHETWCPCSTSHTLVRARPVKELSVLLLADVI